MKLRVYNTAIHISIFGVLSTHIIALQTFWNAIYSLFKYLLLKSTTLLNKPKNL